MSMYGGGFATIPAYLRDLFGTVQVGAIHGRLLTAWSAAGVAGPVLVNYIREYQIEHGVPKAEAYTVDDVHHGRAARGRLRLQPAGPAGRRAPRDRRVRGGKHRRRVKGGADDERIRTTTPVERARAQTRRGVGARRDPARVGRLAGLSEIARPVRVATFHVGILSIFPMKTMVPVCRSRMTKMNAWSMLICSSAVATTPVTVDAPAVVPVSSTVTNALLLQRTTAAAESPTFPRSSL